MNPYVQFIYPSRLNNNNAEYPVQSTVILTTTYCQYPARQTHNDKKAAMLGKTPSRYFPLHAEVLPYKCPIREHADTLQQDGQSLISVRHSVIPYRF